MALEAAQVPRMSQPDPRSLALGPPSEGRQQPLVLQRLPQPGSCALDSASPGAAHPQPKPPGLSSRARLELFHCHSPRGEHAGLAALKSGHELQQKCCQLSQLPGEQCQPRSEHSTLPLRLPQLCPGGESSVWQEPSPAVTHLRHHSSRADLRSCHKRAGGCSLLSALSPWAGAAQGHLLPKDLTQGWQVLRTRTPEALPPTDVLANFPAPHSPS